VNYQVKLNLKNILQSKGWSYRLLAKKTGLSPQTINRLTKDDLKMIRLDTISRLYSALDINFVDLFYISENQSDENQHPKYTK
jgi:putative transcriptional regulator